MPLIEIARTKTKDEAMAALDTWRDRYPAVAERLQPTDVLVDGMRGPSSIWYRIRINLQHVPADQRPPQEQLIADYSPWEGTAERPRRNGPGGASVGQRPGTRYSHAMRQGWNRRGFLQLAGAAATAAAAGPPGSSGCSVTQTGARQRWQPER